MNPGTVRAEIRKMNKIERKEYGMKRTHRADISRNPNHALSISEKKTEIKQKIFEKQCIKRIFEKVFYFSAYSRSRKSSSISSSIEIPKKREIL